MNTNLNLTTLLYFCTVVQHKSMHEAAKILHIAQPSLSIAIKNLETSLHMPLFERKNRHLHLTPEGKSFYIEAQLLLHHANAMETRLESIKKGAHRIKLGIAPMMSNFLLPSIFNIFIKAHPHIEFEVYETGALRLHSLLHNQKLDLAFLIEGAVHHTDIVFTPLLHTNYHLYVGKNDPLLALYKSRKGKPLTLMDYKNSSMIFYKETSYIQSRITQYFNGNHIRPRILMRTNQIQTIKQLVRDSLACAFLTDKAVRNEDNLYKIEIDTTFGITIGIGYNTMQPLTEDMKSFISFLQNTSDINKI